LTTDTVVQRLELELGKQPRAEVDPDLCVAMGAAIQAALIAGTQTHAVLVDVTPYTFGTSALGERDGESYEYCYIPLIRKNTPVPVSKSEVFFTVFDGQPTVEVLVYQGEDPDALNNIEIGRFRVEGLSDVAAGNPIVLGLSLDLDGILEVTAREKTSGLQRSITIGDAIARFERDKLDQARSRVQALFGEGSEAGSAAAADDAGLAVSAPGVDARRLAVEARALVEKAERLLEKAGAQDAEDLVDAVEAIKDALADDEAALKTAMDTLADLLYYLEV
jgi:molecular chaperone DnaK